MPYIISDWVHFSVPLHRLILEFAVLIYAITTVVEHLYKDAVCKFALNTLYSQGHRRQ